MKEKTTSKQQKTTRSFKKRSIKKIDTNQQKQESRKMEGKVHFFYFTFSWLSDLKK
jgi:hypothetical protein